MMEPMVPSRRAPLAERLYARLVPGGPDGTCLEWSGAQLRGYGQIGNAGKILYTHRVAWTLKHGPIPKGMHVCHHCDNPPCCNVEHLFLGDDAANVSDMILKGRAPWQVGTGGRGERNPNAVFTVGDVREVHRLHLRGYSQRQIARQMGAPRRRVRDVIDGKTWAWINDGARQEDT